MRFFNNTSLDFYRKVENLKKSDQVVKNDLDFLFSYYEMDHHNYDVHLVAQTIYVDTYINHKNMRNKGLKYIAIYVALSKHNDNKPLDIIKFCKNNDIRKDHFDRLYDMFLDAHGLSIKQPDSDL